MPSSIPGFEYDLFISYRQNDNKYDGWVTEFVANLNKELEATCKEKINIYFDANPHDGLMETHSVHKTLEHKLNCLIFIPILSRTYCDPKSFAWEHEFVPFVKSAEGDRFGLNVKLFNGNVACRVLPVRIHDLDPEDSTSVEKFIGPIRAVDFIYHSPGVNRSLRPWDDDVIKNTNQPFYRDQINKTANAIEAIIRALKQSERKEKISPRIIKPEVPKKTVTQRKADPFKTPRVLSRSGAWIIFALIIASVLSMGAIWFIKQQRITHAKIVLIPQIQALVASASNPVKVFELATEADEFLSDDSVMIKLWPEVSQNFSLITDPTGAEVYWKDYASEEWKSAGTTPLKEIRMPRGYIKLKIEKNGFQDFFYAGPEMYDPLHLDTIKLVPVKNLQDNMARVQSRITRMYVIGVEQHGGKMVGEFLLDKYEVTNEEYRRFVDAGGYTNKKYWLHPFYLNGKEIPWEEASQIFTDKTGKPGPSTWEVGTFPDGKEKHPVSGISWYEAEAYATYAGKKLPTVFHWSVVAQTSRTMNIIPFSNFNNSRTVPVGSLDGITSFEIYDLAGNVREWCRNESNVSGQRFILGGGFNDPTYSFNDAYTQPAFDRSISNGFRCMQELPGDTTVETLSAALSINFRDYKKEKPVDDKTFNIFKRQFSYDNIPLNAVISSQIDTGQWKIERVAIDAAYNKEQMILYVCIPKSYEPPYQPIIYFPGSGVIFMKTLADRELLDQDFVLKSGRALIYPVFKGTLERADGLKTNRQQETVLYKDHLIMWRKDLGRAIDYLETRPDIQSDKIGYLGYSWGGSMGGILAAIEPRLKALVLHVGGMSMNKTFPEVDQINFLPRVHQPVLMLNGRHDIFFPVETSQKPMFNFLGTSEKDKRMIIYEAGHLVPRLDLVKESLWWYDKYLGVPNNQVTQ